MAPLFSPATFLSATQWSLKRSEPTTPPVLNRCLHPRMSNASHFEFGAHRVRHYFFFSVADCVLVVDSTTVGLDGSDIRSGLTSVVSVVVVDRARRRSCWFCCTPAHFGADLDLCARLAREKRIVLHGIYLVGIMCTGRENRAPCSNGVTGSAEPERRPTNPSCRPCNCIRIVVQRNQSLKLRFCSGKRKKRGQS
jgi:hypothetical protein